MTDNRDEAGAREIAQRFADCATHALTHEEGWVGDLTAAIMSYGDKRAAGAREARQ
jgi:hypothetical protein